MRFQARPKPPPEDPLGSYEYHCGGCITSFFNETGHQKIQRNGAWCEECAGELILLYLLHFRLDKKRSRGLEVLAHVPILPPHLLLGMLTRSAVGLEVRCSSKKPALMYSRNCCISVGLAVQ
jgi:hypothetical protein